MKKEILLCYRLFRFKEEIEPNIIKYKNDIITLIIQNNMEKQYVINNLKDKYNIKEIITVKEVIKGDLDHMIKKFDNMVGNPPYQYPPGEETSKKLYIDITTKVIELGVERIDFITPISIFQEGSKNSSFKYLKNHISSINFDANNDFDIGTIVCAWTYTKEKVNKVKITLNGEDHFVNSFEEAIYFKNSILQNIILKLDYKKNGMDHLYINDSSNEQGITKKYLESKKTEEYCIPVLTKSGSEKYMYSTEKSTEKQIKRNKIIIPYQGGWDKGMIISDDYISNGWFVNNTKSTYTLEELKNIKIYLESKLISYAVINYSISIKPAGMYAFLLRLSEIDFSTSWSNEDLYSKFNINNKEIIEIEKWYSKWKK